MTRKDYILIAEAVKASRPETPHSPDDKPYLSQCFATANALARALANDNPRFDRERFLKACGVRS